MRTACVRARRLAGTTVLAAIVVGIFGAGSAVSDAASSSPAAASCPTPPASQSQPWLDPSYTPACRAQYVVAALPLVSQKVTALTDNDNTFTNMGIAMPTGGDGPAGDVTGNGVAQSPAPIVLGATWSTAMAAQYGNELGRRGLATRASSTLRCSI